tara:strand:- start:375 stop:713 length:339 start_codon:yes stop_codon:yes gene_type:complete
MYVVETYYRDNDQPVPHGLVMSEIIMCIFFMAHFFLQFFVAVNRCGFLLSAHSIVDLLIIFPPLIFFAMNQSASELNKSDVAKAIEENNFFVLMRIFRVLRIIRVSRELSKR